MSIELTKFLNQLDEREIIYCSWKNNHLLDDVFSCKKDLDIYVPLRQKRLFLSVIYDAGFIEGESHLSLYPYVHHYYVPSENGRLLHLHVYFRLMTGESQLKDYWLPLEQRLEKSRVRSGRNVYVPDDECQRMIYVLRHYLKKSSLMGLMLHRRESQDYREELNGLRSCNVGNETSSLIDGPLVRDLDRLMSQAGVFKTWWLGMMLRRKLRGLRRYSNIHAFAIRYGLMLCRVLNKLFWHRKKTLLGGGRFVAITGLDGSGKSSIIKAVSNTISSHFTVRQVHFGRPPATLLTLPVRLVLFIRRWLPLGSVESDLHYQNSTERTGIVTAARYAVLAYERKQLMINIFKHVCNGEIVISDRYPSSTVGKMDSPRILIEGGSVAVRWLGNFERNCYQLTACPDLLIELYVPVAVAIKRNNDRVKSDKETESELLERYENNSNLDYRVVRHVRVNNDQPFEKAKMQIMELVWQTLK